MAPLYSAKVCSISCVGSRRPTGTSPPTNMIAALTPSPLPRTRKERHSDQILYSTKTAVPDPEHPFVSVKPVESSARVAPKSGANVASRTLTTAHVARANDRRILGNMGKGSSRHATYHRDDLRRAELSLKNLPEFDPMLNG